MSMGSMWLLNAGNGLLVGLPLGCLFYKSTVFKPTVIKDQFSFTDYTMLKTFLSAVSTSTAAITLLEGFGLMHLAPKAFLNINTVAGGAFLGLGMSLCGACPGTILAQIGENPKSLSKWVVLLGGLMGTTAYGFLHNKVAIKGSIITVMSLFNASYSTLSLPFILLLGFALYCIEVSQPSNFTMKIKPAPPSNAIAKWFWDDWSPLMCGACIGLLQIPPLLFANYFIGTSSAYVTVAAETCNALLTGGQMPSYFSRALLSANPKNIFQIFLNVGVAFGTFFTKFISNSSEQAQPDTRITVRSTSNWIDSYAKPFVGGFLLLFGARLANGCTSGHGISGVAQLSVSSLVATFTMFTFAIVGNKFGFN